MKTQGLNILFDLRWMAIGSAGGKEQLAFELVASLVRIQDGGTLFVYCPKRTFREWCFGPATTVQCIDSDRVLLVPEISPSAKSQEDSANR